jgi:hypothetical protein
MRRIYLIVFILLFTVSACKKDKGSSDAGTITINNELIDAHTNPYIYGFSVNTGMKVSTLNSPKDVITIQEDDLNMVVRKLFFTCENQFESFFRYGDYNDQATAKTAFDNLKTFTASAWTFTGDSIKPNQIWLFRTTETKYAKIRVINTFTEIRAGMVFPYAECTFEWVFQPDGTSIFP